MAIGLIIIGDEIMSGKRSDQHFPNVVQILKERGLSLDWARYIGDEPERIIAVLRETLASSDIVFCCGGIGSTPDDHTRQCASIALGKPLELHPEAKAKIYERIAETAKDPNHIDYDSPDNIRRLKMGEYPSGSRIIPNPVNRIPGFSYGTHYFVPGFPQMAKAISVPVHMVDRSADLAEDAGYYAEEVRRFVSARYGDEAIYNGGLFIRTSLDPELQKLAVHSLQNGLLKYDKRHGWRGPLAHYETIDAAKAALTTWPDLPYLPKGWSVAVVTALTPDAAEIVLKDGQTGKIPIKALSWAQKALEGGRIDKAKVTKPADVLAVGDLVYVSQTTSAEVFDLQQMPQAEGALVALDPHTGRVLALSGGFSFQKNQFNRAVQAFRQPGSSFKPFVYLAALDSGYTPSSLILDAPLVMEQPDGTKWKPKNYSKIFYGPTTLRVGIEKSRNLMTIRLARAIGMRKVLAYAEKFGISDKLEPVLATALGAGETTLIKLTAAYGMLVNGGREITPNFIDRIQDRDGRTIYKHDRRACYNCSGDTASGDILPSVPDPRPQIQDPVSAYQMVNILSGVVERGTGRSVKSLGKTLGAKSGTSNDSFDAWFIGFSPDLVVGVWVGFDQPQTLGPNDTGGVVAAPIFKEFMAEALKDKSDIPFRIPPGVRLVRVDATTGKPAQSGNKNIIQEAFRLDTDLSRPTKIVGEDITIKTDEEEAPDIGGVY